MKDMKTVEQQREILAQNIKKLLHRNGKSQADMARDLKLAETTVSSWINSERYPRLDKIQMMADYFNVRRSQLTEDQAPNLTEITPFTVPIPILGNIACGDPLLAEANLAGYRYESPDLLPHGTLYYLRAKGDSMEPTIPDGSIVLIRQQDEVENGEIAAVLVNGDTEATLKRIKRQDNIVMLLPDNSSHEPIIVTPGNPARIIGKAIRFTQDL